MIDLNFISGFYAEPLRANPAFTKHMIKEYIQLMVLDYLSNSQYIKKLAYIGGTNLRLVKGIDRFSEDLDFDLRDMSADEFVSMTDDIVGFLRLNGLNVEVRDRKNDRLTAFRRSIYFPQLLFDLHLSGHKDERFLLKIEAQDQCVSYEPVIVNVNRCGFFFPLPVPPDSVLLSMKLSALISRAKGRDFYDTMFLWNLAAPDYAFLQKRIGITSPEQLRTALNDMLAKTDLTIKKRDFEHLLFSDRNSEKILRFGDFVNHKLN